MTKYYVGGSLFTNKQRAQRMQEGDMLANFEGAVIYNPVLNDEINDKTKQPTAQDIFFQDTTHILESDIITADLDDEDMGLAMELGVAFGANYIRTRVIQALNSESPIQELHLLLQQIPHKTIYGTCSDIRQDTENEIGEHKSWGINQYVIGGVEAMGEVFRSFDDAYAHMVQERYTKKEEDTMDVTAEGGQDNG